MSLWTNIVTAVKTTYSKVFSKPSTPAYTIYTSGTPAGQTRTTTGQTISTPGTAAQPGVSGTYGGGGGGGGYAPTTDTSTGYAPTQTVTPKAPTRLTPSGLQSYSPILAGKTISAQIEAKPSQVSLPSDLPQDRTAFRTGGVEAAKGFFGTMGYNIKQFVGGSREYKDPIKSLELAAKPKREQVAYYQPIFGTVARDQPISKPITYGDIQKDIEFKRSSKIGEERYIAEVKLGDFYSNLQKQIDVGEVSYDTALDIGRFKTAELTREFQTKAEGIYAKYPGVSGIDVRTSGLVSGVRIIKDITIYSTPLTSAAALATETKKAPLLIRGDVSKDMSLQYLDYKTTPGMYAASGIVAGHGAVALARAGRAVTLGRVSSALEQRPTIVTGQRLTTKEGVLDITKFKARGDYSIARGETISYSKLTKDGKKVLVYGETDVTVATKTYFGEKPFIVGKRETFTGEVEILKKTKGVYPSLTKIKTSPVFEYSITGKPGVEAKLKGTIYTTPKQSKPVLIGGLSRKEGEYIYGGGGRIIGTRYTGTKGKGFKILEKAEFVFPVEQKSILREVKPMINVEKYGAGKGYTPTKDVVKIDRKMKPFTQKRPTFETRPQIQISQPQLSQVTPTTITKTKIKPSSISKQRAYLIPSIITSQSMALSELRKTRFSPRALYSSALAGGMGLKESLVLSEGMLLKPKVKLNEIQLLEQGFADGGLVPPPITPHIPPPILKPGFRFVIPPFRALNLAGASGGKGQRGIQQQKYTPDLRSALTGITATKIPKAYSRGAGGLISRPIIRRSVKR